MPEPIAKVTKGALVGMTWLGWGLFAASTLTAVVYVVKYNNINNGKTKPTVAYVGS